MERSEEALRERVRETPLSERLKTCEKYVASMCAERRPPKMTIPLQHYDEDFYIYTTLADAQATIAALQARVRELEAQHEDLVERNRILRHRPDLPVERTEFHDRFVKLQSQLTQRTAELEAANKHWDALWNAACEQKDTLQAELERVRGELAEKYKYHELFKQWQCWRDPDELVSEYEKYQAAIKENEILRALIAALPKVEGAVVVSNGYVKDSTRCHALFGADEDAALYAALLQHRQGMEG